MPGQTILVIDTDLETMQRMISILESEDYLVFTASNMESSITMAKKVNPSLIFINIGMSGVSGLEIAKMIHETESLQEIPIIIVTPHGGTVDPRYTSVYGIVDFMPKEFSPEDLVATTKTVLGQQAESPQFFEEKKFEKPTEETTSEEPVSEDTPIVKEEPTIQVNIQEEPEELHRDEEVIPQDEPLLEETADLSKEEPSEASPLLQEEEQEGTPPPVFTEIIEEPPLDDQTEKSEEFVSPKIVEPEKKKSTSKMLPLLILLLIIVAGAGIFYYTTQRGSETPIETAAVISDQKLPGESKTKASKTEKPQSKPSSALQTKPEKPNAQATTPSVKKPSASAPKKSKAVSTASKQTRQTYSVQVGAFKDKMNADTYTKQLVEKGYDARVHKTALADKGTLYRVLIGKFDQKKQASQMAKTVRIKEKVATVLFRE